MNFRTLANYVSSHIAFASIKFLSTPFREALLNYETAIAGTEDLEQRWKFCTTLASNLASVTSGAIYINNYFNARDKSVAKNVMDYVFDAYNEFVNNSSWLNGQVKENILKYTNEKITKYVGYHDNLMVEGK